MAEKISVILYKNIQARSSTTIVQLLDNVATSHNS